MAVPSLVASVNVTLPAVTCDSATVNVAVLVPLLPSFTETSAMLRVGSGLSSSRMVPTPWLSVTLAPTRPLRLTLMVSLLSAVVSPLTVTANVVLVWPAGIVKACVRVT